MILSKYGIFVSENEIKEKAFSYNRSNPLGYTYVFALRKAINYFLSSNGKTIRYMEEYVANDTDDNMYGILILLLIGTTVLFKFQLTTKQKQIRVYLTEHRGIIS